MTKASEIASAFANHDCKPFFTNTKIKIANQLDNTGMLIASAIVNS